MCLLGRRRLREGWSGSLGLADANDYVMYFPGGSGGKVSAYNVGDLGSILGSGRSPGEGNGNPLQHSYLENPMNRGAWYTTVLGVTKSQTQLSDFAFIFTFHVTYRKDEQQGPTA